MKQIDYSEELLNSIIPARLIEQKMGDDVADFFLVWGLFYNDLKSLFSHYLRITEEEKKKNVEKISSDAGEYNGMRVQLVRLITATLYEFLEFLEKNKKILTMGEFQIIHRTLNRDLSSKWNTIVDIALRKQVKKITDFSKILELIRHNLAFHYSQSGKNLRKGFIEYFFIDPKHDANAKAYYSIGGTMHNTRFFYCDAAVERSMADQVIKKMAYKEFISRLLEIVEYTNFTIMALMKEYLRNRPYRG